MLELFLLRGLNQLMSNLFTEKGQNALAIFMAILGMFLMFYWFLPLSFPEETAEAPVQEMPITETGAQVHTIPVLSEKYIPLKNPFEKSAFDKAPTIVMRGEFESASMHIKGTILGEGDRFLIFNFNGEGGLIKAVRSAVNKINLTETKRRGGVFSNDNPIDVSLDLMTDSLGTIGSEYAKTQLGSRIFNFIDDIQQPTVTQLLVIPFKVNGEYGGASIDELKIQYTCKAEGGCEIHTCSSQKLYTECLNEYFGPEVMREWMNRYGY